MSTNLTILTSFLYIIFLMSFICCDLLKGWVTLTKGQLRYFVLSFFRCSVAMLYQTNCCSYMIDDVSCLILRYCNSKHLQTTYQQQRTKKSNKRTFSFLNDSYCYRHFVLFKWRIHCINFNIPFVAKGMPYSPLQILSTLISKW